jgi:cyclin-dependent kinase 12/13
MAASNDSKFTRRFSCFNQSLGYMWPHQDAILLSTWFVNVTFDINLHLFAELQRWRFVTQANAKSKSKKFPPPHQDGAVGYPLDASRKGPVSFGAPDTSFGSSLFNSKSSGTVKSIGASGGPSRRKTIKEDLHAASSRKFIRAFKPSSLGLSLDLIFKGK